MPVLAEPVTLTSNFKISLALPYIASEIIRCLSTSSIEVSNVIFNSDTKKELYDEYLKEFDKGSIKVIIGGSALVEALSLYRLSLIIDTDLSLSDNGIVQLVGRLKRKNPEICDKQKVYMKLIYKNISEKKFRNTKKADIIKNDAIEVTFMATYLNKFDPKISPKEENFLIYIYFPNLEEQIDFTKNGYELLLNGKTPISIEKLLQKLIKLIRKLQILNLIFLMKHIRK
jgi:superfamily II DNA or RNA helicase